jgi:hypothetical protein
MMRGQKEKNRKHDGDLNESKKILLQSGGDRFGGLLIRLHGCQAKTLSRDSTWVMVLTVSSAGFVDTRCEPATLL